MLVVGVLTQPDLSFVDDCYFQVKITENNSGISKVIDIRFDDEVVTGVSVNTTEMQF